MFPIEQADQLILDQLAKFCQGEFYRLIDVENDMVYDYRDGELKGMSEPCYAVWKRNRPCINCISRRALKEGKSFIKVEMTEGRGFLVCASPVMIKSRKLSLESIWNITESLVTENNETGENGLIRNLIDRINLSISQDVYTGLYNKIYAERELQNAIQTWKKECPLVAVMIDIDRFKEVNDQFGHVQGDLVIKELAEIFLKWATQHSGTACRIGGDEFFMIIKGLSLKEVESAVEVLKKDVSGHAFAREYPLSITISTGTAEYTPDMNSWEQLADKADKRMYLEKSAKR